MLSSKRSRAAVAHADEALRELDMRGSLSMGDMNQGDDPSWPGEMKDSDDIDDACPVSPTKRAASASARRRRQRKEPENEYAEEEEEPVEAAVPRASLRESSRGAAEAKASDTAVDDETPRGLGAEATIRFQKAKMKAMKEAAKKSAARIQLLEKKVNDMQTTLKKTKAEAAKLTKVLNSTKSSLEKQQRANQSSNDKIGELERQVGSLQAELKRTGRAAKQVESEGNTKDIRLGRALDELERQRELVKQLKSQLSESDGAAQQSHRGLQDTIRRLEKQRSELIVAFRKQLKLIDVLKRQKMHMEAAKLLSFTEEEFRKCIDL